MHPGKKEWEERTGQLGSDSCPLFPGTTTFLPLSSLTASPITSPGKGQGWGDQWGQEPATYFGWKIRRSLSNTLVEATPGGKRGCAPGAPTCLLPPWVAWEQLARPSGWG